MNQRVCRIKNDAIVNSCLLGLGIVALAIGALGCSKSLPNAPDPLVVQARPDCLWRLCQAELKQRGFRLDRVDRRAGIIKTYPLTGKQWFEFWRRDVVTDQDVAESSLHTIRRKVYMNVAPAPEDRYRLQCRVTVERLSAQPVWAGGRVRVQDIFGRAAGRAPVLQVTEKRKLHPPTWVPIGQDHSLETDILQAIHHRLNRNRE